jgi:N-acetylglutamate synthase-like GNAT family acetyltransferase
LRGFQNNNRLNGYALYAIDGKLMDLEIVCSRRDHTVGQFLVESVIARAREEEVSAIQLYCLPMVGLRRWYERLGFRYVNDIVDPTTGENKVCRMQMNL